MALGATIYKIELHVADNDRHYYGSHSLTIARHPSETAERMMARLIAFSMHAHEDLVFNQRPRAKRMSRTFGSRT